MSAAQIDDANFTAKSQPFVGGINQGLSIRSKGCIVSAKWQIKGYGFCLVYRHIQNLVFVNGAEEKAFAVWRPIEEVTTRVHNWLGIGIIYILKLDEEIGFTVVLEDEITAVTRPISSLRLAHHWLRLAGQRLRRLAVAYPAVCV